VAFLIVGANLIGLNLVIKMDWKKRYQGFYKGCKVKALKSLPGHYNEGDILILDRKEVGPLTGKIIWRMDDNCGIYEHEMEMV